MKNMINVNKAMLNQRVIPTERLHKAALLMVACNTIMLGVCDDIKETEVYHHQTKALTNQLTKHLEAFVAKMYRGISPEMEQQYLNLVRVVEQASVLICSMTPHEIADFVLLLTDFKNGDIYRPTSPKQLENIINQKRVVPIKAK